MIKTLNTSAGGISLVTFVVRLLVLCMLPLLLLAAWLTFNNFKLHEANDHTAAAMSQHVASVVDDYLAPRIKALEQLALTPMADDGDARTLYQAARDFLARHGNHVVLVRLDEPPQVVFDTRQAFDAPAPARDPGARLTPAHAATLAASATSATTALTNAAASATPQATVGDLFSDPATQAHLLTITVPLADHDAAPHALLATIDSAQLGERITRLTLAEGWSVRLLDGLGQPIANSGAPGAAIDADPAHRYVVASALAPWTVSLDISRDAHYAPIFATGTTLIAGLLGASLLGVFGGAVASRRLSHAVARLGQRSGAPASPADSRIKEINDARETLERSATGLMHSEARYRQLFHQAPVAMIHVNDEGDILAQNIGFEQLFGYSADDVPTLSAWCEKAYPDGRYRELAIAHWRTAIRLAERDDAMIEGGEYRVVCKNGSERIVQIRCLPIDEGALTAFFDVTERREAENRLQLWVKAFEGSQLGMVITDARTDVIIDVNPAFARERGYERAEMIGMHISPLFRSGVLARLRASMRNRRGISHAVLESEHLCKDGRRIPVLLDITLLRDAGGAAVSCITYAQDLTERKRTERTLAKAQKTALEEQRQGRLAALNLMEDAQAARRQAEETSASLLKLSQAVEQSPESIVITNIDAKIEYVNEAFVSATGYSREEAIGLNPRVLNRGRTPQATYRDLWATLTRGEVWNGEFLNTRKDGSEYVESATIAPIKQADGTVTHYVAVKEDITARRQSEELIHRLAYFDTLTTLPNRTLLLDRLGQAMLSCDRSKSAGMLLLIDVDNFQILNDTQGHESGDRLLQEIAQRLLKVVRADDTVARFGGDEFALIVEHLGDSAECAVTQAEMIAEKIHSELNQSYDLQLPSGNYHATPSIGITVFDGSEGTVEGLLQQAEVALYKAKSDGRNAVRFFDPKMQAVVEARATLERGMRDALANNEFKLFYQPQVDRAGRVVGAEALIRWITADGAMVSPAEFIPLAEETGLILNIGDWVVGAGCAQLKAWQQHADTRHLVLAINVSARQFHQQDFVARVRGHIERSGIKPGALKLELTESVILGDIDETIARMDQIKSLGVRFALDDFGTGYSSLSYLKRLPFDQLKIDQSFVRDMTVDNNSSAIVHAILAMSESLSLEVVAEGVETTAQRDLLQAGGCQIYQGYLFGRPMPIETWALSSVCA